MRLRRGPIAEWLRWTALFAIALPGFGAQLTLASALWSLPTAAIVAYVFLPGLRRFRAASVNAGARLRRPRPRHSSNRPERG